MSARWDGGVGTLQWQGPRHTLGRVIVSALVAVGIGWAVPSWAFVGWIGFILAGLWSMRRSGGGARLTWDERRLTLERAGEPSTTLAWSEVTAIRVGSVDVRVRTATQTFSFGSPAGREARQGVAAVLERAREGQGPALRWEGRGDHERLVWGARELRVAPTHLVWVDGREERWSWDELRAVEGFDEGLRLVGAGRELQLGLGDVAVDQVFGLGQALRERMARYRSSDLERERVDAARGALARREGS